ncbi:hypothetical protein TRFO_16354 [Tritrichomonas foetus]|uniref:Uncharacterized protein n=1 Tax=Tritrichomonas foetus TaxID=1144522 RepID=A0A1J4KUP5_9EUKA|nr:hypothetical protein TRFO_16354 [Tritrichomonas foetus]|eukprot:OHT13484.1 hypothetical protein TRFO_16354 [Tritrichomonas foetus]
MDSNISSPSIKRSPTSSPPTRISYEDILEFDPLAPSSSEFTNKKSTKISLSANEKCSKKFEIHREPSKFKDDKKPESNELTNSEKQINILDMMGKNKKSAENSIENISKMILYQKDASNVKKDANFIVDSDDEKPDQNSQKFQENEEVEVIKSKETNRIFSVVHRRPSLRQVQSLSPQSFATLANCNCNNFCVDGDYPAAMESLDRNDEKLSDESDQYEDDCKPESRKKIHHGRFVIKTVIRRSSYNDETITEQNSPLFSPFSSSSSFSSNSSLKTMNDLEKDKEMKEKKDQQQNKDKKDKKCMDYIRRDINLCKEMKKKPTKRHFTVSITVEKPIIRRKSMINPDNFFIE